MAAGIVPAFKMRLVAFYHHHHHHNHTLADRCGIDINKHRCKANNKRAMRHYLLLAVEEGERNASLGASARGLDSGGHRLHSYSERGIREMDNF